MFANAFTFPFTEFIEVGKPIRALDALAEVIKSKKYRSTTYSEKILEPIMIKYLELCVDLKKAYMAKEGLFQYRNMCQSVSTTQNKAYTKNGCHYITLEFLGECCFSRKCSAILS